MGVGRDKKGREEGEGNWGETKSEPREWGETKKEDKGAKGIGARQKNKPREWREI